MDSRTIEIPKKMVEALKRLEYKTESYRDYLKWMKMAAPTIYKGLKDEDHPDLYRFGAEGDPDDILLFQLLTVSAMHAYDNDDNEDKQWTEKEIKRLVGEQ